MVARAEARTPDPLQCLIFRSLPEPGRPLKRCARTSAVARALASVPQSPVAAGVWFRTQGALLLLAMPAFFVAWASPLFVPTSISHFSLHRISSSRFLVSVSGCGVASFLALEISLVSQSTRRVFRVRRIDRAVSPHGLARAGDPRPMRQKRAQLPAKCESAPLRRSVTERAIRSTLTALIC